MISRLVTAALGTLIVLAATTHTRTVEQAPYSASSDDCGMFNCSATVDTSEVVQAPQLRCWFNDHEDGSTGMICDGVEYPMNALEDPHDDSTTPFPQCERDSELSPRGLVLVKCHPGKVYEVQQDGNYVLISGPVFADWNMIQ